MSNFIKVVGAENFLPILAVVIVGMGMLLIPVSVQAAGTDSGLNIVNALSSPSSLPTAEGQMSLQYTNKQGVDTDYSDTAQPCTSTVILAYDLSFLDTTGNNGVANHDADGWASGQAGDSFVFTVGVFNRGNGPLTISADSLALSTYDNWQDQANGYYRIYRDVNLNNQFEPATDLQVTDSTFLQEDAVCTFFLVVRISDTAANNDSSVVRVRITNNAPTVYNAGVGDGWQEGTVDTDGSYYASIWNDATYPQTTATAVERDTQYAYFFTIVQGPVMYVGKQVNLGNAGRSRPGDTIIYTIYYDNDGSGTASRLVIVDGIPTNTTLIDTDYEKFLHTGGQWAVTWDNNFAAGGESSNPANLPTARRVIYDLSSGWGVGPTVEADNQTADKGQAADKGYISFVVKIN